MRSVVVRTEKAVRNLQVSALVLSSHFVVHQARVKMNEGVCEAAPVRLYGICQKLSTDGRR